MEQTGGGSLVALARLFRLRDRFDNPKTAPASFAAGSSWESEWR